MWTHLDCTCSVICINGVWTWRTEKISGDKINSGVATSEKEAIEKAEQASAKLSGHRS